MVPIKKTSTEKVIVDQKIHRQETVSITRPLAQKTVQEEQLVVEPVYNEPEFDEYQEQDSEIYFEHEPFVNRPNRIRQVIWMIAIACVIALVLGIGGLLAHATVTITPQKYSGQVTTTVTFSQVREKGAIPFSVVSKKITHQVVVPMTSTATEAAAAMGTVRFYNSALTAQVIPKGTLIVSKSANLQYMVSKTITIPKGKSGTAGQVDGVVTAIANGANYNDALDDFTLVKPLVKNPSITIHSVTQITGGAQINDAVADPAQVANAQTNLATMFTASAATALLVNEIPDDMVTLPISIPPSNVSFTVEAGHTDGVHITGSETVSILIIHRSDIAKTLGALLSVGDTIPVTLPSFDGLTVTTNSLIQGQTIPQTILASVSGTAQIVGYVDMAHLSSSLVGMRKGAAIQSIEKIPSVAKVSISMRPFWRFVLPTDSSKITVVGN